MKRREHLLQSETAANVQMTTQLFKKHRALPAITLVSIIAETGENIHGLWALCSPGSPWIKGEACWCFSTETMRLTFLGLTQWINQVKVSEGPFPILAHHPLISPHMAFPKCEKESNKQKNTSFSVSLCFIIDAPGTDLGYTLLAQMLFSKVIPYSAQ